MSKLQILNAVLAFSLGCVIPCRGQLMGGDPPAEAVADFNFIKGFISMEEKEASSEMVGSYYLNDEYSKGTIELAREEAVLKSYPFKYNLKENTIELKVMSQVKVCPVDRIHSFQLQSESGELRTFRNCAKYRFPDGEPLIGVFEVITSPDDPYQLLVKTDISITRPTYNPALDVGERNAIINQNETYYLSDGTTAFLISSRKKEAFKLFGDLAPEVEAFMKAEKLKLRDRTDLLRIVNHYNSLQ